MISGSPEDPKLGVKIAFIWGALNVGCWAYVYFFIPELKGLHLEQVDELFARSVTVLMVDLRPRSNPKSH